MLTDADMIELRDAIRRIEVRAIRSFDDNTTAQEGAEAQLAAFNEALNLIEIYKKQGTHPLLKEISERVERNYTNAAEHLKTLAN